VRFLKALKGEAYVKMFGCQKAAPFVVEESPVGLEAVPAFPARGEIFFLQGNGFFKKIDSCEGRLSPVPGE